jgi:membrane protein DedA with SNARE-associated domain
LIAVLVGAILGAGSTWIIGKVHTEDLLRRLMDALRDRWHVSLEEEFLMTQLLRQ